MHINYIHIYILIILVVLQASTSGPGLEPEVHSVIPDLSTAGLAFLGPSYRMSYSRLRRLSARIQDEFDEKLEQILLLDDVYCVGYFRLVDELARCSLFAGGSGI